MWITEEVLDYLDYIGVVQFFKKLNLCQRIKIVVTFERDYFTYSRNKTSFIDNLSDDTPITSTDDVGEMI